VARLPNDLVELERGLGKIVGTRTGGKVSGPAGVYLLNDGSFLLILSLSEVGAHGEIIDGIGVAPDDSLPLTAAALSAGHDPDIEKAISLLRSRSSHCERRGKEGFLPPNPVLSTRVPGPLRNPGSTEAQMDRMDKRGEAC